MSAGQKGIEKLQCDFLCSVDTNRVYIEESTEAKHTCDLNTKLNISSLHSNIWINQSCFGNKYCGQRKLKGATEEKKKKQHLMRR